MPWCNTCDRYLAPNALNEDGTCPSCGRKVEIPSHELKLPADQVAGEAGAATEERVRAPWHFWLMIVALVIYLGWRFLQGLDWAFRHWF
ncbi:MAG: hypothetical protein WC184_01145 [Acidimicrobiia bacterium]